MLGRIALSILTALLASAPALVAGDACAAPQSPSAREIRWNPGPEIKSRHYRILSDLGQDETRAYVQHLDLIFEEYARRLASLEQRAPEIPYVMMFAREQDYLDVLRNRYGVNGTGSGGMFFITPAGAALAFFTEGLPRSRVLHVIQHEGFHQYAHSKFVGQLPPWLNEGLAEYFGEAIVIDGRVVVGQASIGPVESIRKAIEEGRTIDFLRLLTMTGDEWNANVRGGDAAIQYMQSWSIVQYLSWADGGRYQGRFEAYLRLIHGGMPSDRAFVQAFGTNDLAQFEGAWKEWARKAKPSSLGTAAMRLTFMAEGLQELSRDGIKVDSFDELLAKLRERNFTTEVSIHGRTERVEANERILEIPKDELAREQPVFDMIPPVFKRQTTADRKREADHPTPPVITTRGLQPRELVLKWTRLKSGAFEYEIESPKKAPAPPKGRKAKPGEGDGAGDGDEQDGGKDATRDATKDGRDAGDATGAPTGAKSSPKDRG
jgi:hypothetical protein